MIIESLREVFNRDLHRLSEEINQYKNSQSLWAIEKQITNSAGNLCLHIIGNLNTYIGKEIGKTGYVRNRELEFSAKDIPKKDLLNKITNTIDIVETSLNKLNDNSLSEDYPIIVWEEKTSIGYMLIHLATHLTYHLGQINYHRRLLDK